MDVLYGHAFYAAPPHQKMRVRPPHHANCMHRYPRAAAPLAHFETAPMEDNSPPRSSPSDPVRNRPPSYLEQLRGGAAALPRLPYLEQLRQGVVEQERRRTEQEEQASRFDLPETPPGKLDPALRDALAALLAYTLASGRDRISSRDIFRRLRVPSRLEQSEGRAIAQCLKSLGWVRVHWGKDAPGQRVWGWRWREWNVSHVKVDLNS